MILTDSWLFLKIYTTDLDKYNQISGISLNCYFKNQLSISWLKNKTKQKYRKEEISEPSSNVFMCYFLEWILTKVIELTASH